MPIPPEEPQLQLPEEVDEYTRKIHTARESAALTAAFFNTLVANGIKGELALELTTRWFDQDEDID